MDHATREHFIKLMREKIEHDLKKNKEDIEDFERLGKQLLSNSEIDNGQEELVIIEEPRIMHIDELIDDDELFPEGDEEYDYDDELIDLPNLETGLETMESPMELQMEIQEPLQEGVKEQDLLLEEETGSLLVAAEKKENNFAVGNDFVQKEQVEIDAKTPKKEQIIKEMVEHSSELLTEESKPRTTQVKTPSRTTIPKVSELELKIQEVTKNFEKEFEILKTMHRLERWELEKQHRQFEADFVNEYKDKIKKLQGEI